MVWTDGAANNATIPCPLCGSPMAQDAPGNPYRCPACGFIREDDAALQIGPGTIVADKYRVLNPLGKGGNGSIFLCHPLHDVHTRYALKILQKGKSPQDLRRFEREADLLMRLNENNVIVNLIDYWTDATGAYIVLEYIDGKNLRDSLDEYTFDEEMVLTVAHEVCAALQFAWNSFQLIHRDIKPDNVMIDKDGYIRLLDFGLAKSLDVSSYDTTLTIQNTGMGTPGFMSPEQYREAKGADFRSDIFSVGALMYYLFTGEKAFDGRNYMNVYQNTIANLPLDLERLTPRYCSVECAQLVQWMMQCDPADRPDSYETVLEAIERLLPSGNPEN